MSTITATPLTVAKARNMQLVREAQPRRVSVDAFRVTRRDAEIALAEVRRLYRESGYDSQADQGCCFGCEFPELEARINRLHDVVYAYNRANPHNGI